MFYYLFDQFGGARKDAGEYWREVVMKEQPLPDAVQGLVRLQDQMENGCHDDHKKPEKLELIKEETFMVNLRNGRVEKKMMKEEEEDITKDFEPRPNASAYGDRK